MNEEEAVKNIFQRAREKIDWMKRTERLNGFASPENLYPIDHLRTALVAIEAGITIKDWDTVAEGYVMAKDVCDRVEKGNRKHENT